MSTSPRVALAAAIQVAVDAGWNVYGSPPEVLAIPAVVIRPGDPYQAPATAAGTAGAAWAFDIDIVVHRSSADRGLDALEVARETVTGALPVGYRWIEFGDIGELVVNKKTYLKGTLGVGVINTEGVG